MRTVCVYCSSSNRVAEPYVQATRDVAAQIVANGYELIYGGADAGLMGLVASEVKRLGGRVIGVIPEKLADKGIAWKGADECVITRDMRERKRIMDECSDAVITLPGGFGTLEEVLEIITLKQLQYHNKPIVLLNTLGFFDDLIRLFSRMFDENFAYSEFRNLYFVAANAVDALRYVREYIPPKPIEKWGG